MEKKLTQGKAGTLLGLTTRHIRRLIERVEHEGDQGLAVETLAARHGITLSDETLRRWLRERGIDHFARRRHPHRAWRERKAHVGELIQLDGSHHDWLEGRGPHGVLMASIDDASSRVFARAYRQTERAATSEPPLLTP